MVLHNPNNWHWVNKDASAWARQYLEESLAKVETADSGVTAKISKVVSMDGDVDVSQRKGKVITIYDVKLVLEYTGRSINASTCISHPVKKSRSTDFLCLTLYHFCEVVCSGASLT